MKVLFLPSSPGNPYQQNLARHLFAKDVKVDLTKKNSLNELGDLFSSYNLIHIHWTHPYIIGQTLKHSIKASARFLLLLAAAKRKGIKLVWTVHNLGEHERRYPFFEKSFHMIFSRFVDLMIAHSQFAKEKVVSTYHLGHNVEKVHVVPHGHYIDNYPNNISREEARASLEISLSKKVFLFCGSIRSYKGLPELISAFKNISSGNEFLILAGRPLNEQIKTEIRRLVEGQEDILFSPDFTPDQRIQVYMNASDAVIFPFRDVFTSGSILLAMSFAKAIVVPNLESLNDIIDSGGAVPFDQLDDGGLANALKEVLCSDIEKLSRNSFNFVQKFSWEAIANDTHRLYVSCLSDKF